MKGNYERGGGVKENKGKGWRTGMREQGKRAKG